MRGVSNIIVCATETRKPFIYKVARNARITTVKIP